ncbi:hypothetical protein [Marinomonas polaris]|uniref:hypothetical protein n=1 Tax=Marinomonas polaris TaxID=293552 RepID=UPI003F9A4FA8
MKKIKYTFAIVTLFSCMVLLFDGFGDFALYARHKIAQFNKDSIFLDHLPDNTDRAIYERNFSDSQKLTFYNAPFLDRIIEPGEYGIYKIDDYGHRVFPADTSISQVQQKTMLLLGSSQSFGYHIEAKDALSTQMQGLLPDYKIDNYSMLGINLDGNFVDWYRMSAIEKKRYDLVVIVNGFFSHYVECTKNVSHSQIEAVIEKYRLPALVSIVRSLKDKVTTINSLCEQPEYQNIAARRVDDRWDQLLEFGKEQGSKTLIFIPPSVWSENANVENLQPHLNEKHRAIYSAINNRIYSQIDNSAIINLTHAFDDGRQYFLDGGSHFTPEGSALFAREVAKHIQDLDNKAVEGN